MPFDRQLNLFSGKEMRNKKRNIQLQIEREEEYIDLMKAVHRCEKTKAVLEVAMVTGIYAATQHDMPKHKNTCKELKEQLNEEITEVKAKQKKLRQSFNAGEKELNDLTKKELKFHKMRLGLGPKSLNQQLAKIISSVKGNKYNPSKTSTMEDDEYSDTTYGQIFGWFEEIDKSDKLLGVLFSNFKRSSQLCQEQKKRLKERSSKAMCWDIPTEFVTVKEKIDYLDFKA